MQVGLRVVRVCLFCDRSRSHRAIAAVARRGARPSEPGLALAVTVPIQAASMTRAMSESQARYSGWPHSLAARPADLDAVAMKLAACQSRLSL